jgi:hypothetical protein
MLAAERFHGSRRVDVGHRDDARQPELLEIVPAHLELLGVRHVGHRATCCEIRKNHLLMIGAEHVGALGHEMDAAENDEVRLRVSADLAGELERVAGVVCELDHFVALIVMPENHEPGAERRPGAGNADIHLLVGQTEIPLRQRLPFGDVFLLVRGQDRQQHCSIFGASPPLDPAGRSTVRMRAGPARPTL